MQLSPKSKKTSFKASAILCWLGWVFDFYDLILIAFLIPAIETSLQVSPEASPWLLGIGLGGSGIGGLLFGWLGDQYGRKKMLTLTVVIFSLGMLITAFTQTTGQFLIVRFITGLGLGGEWALGHALIAESVPAHTRARWGAFLQSGEPIGVAIAAIMGFMVAPYIGWRMVFVISSLTGLLTLVFRRYLRESPVWLSAPRISSKQRFKTLLPFIKNYKVLLFLALMLALFKLGTYWTCYTWLPRFIKQSFGLAIGKSALWILCGQLGQLLGIFTFGLVADKIGRRWAWSFFSLLTAMVLFSLGAYWSSLFNIYPVLFWGLMFLLGFGSGCVAGFGPLLSEIFPMKQRTFAMGTVLSSARSLCLFFPFIVERAANRGGIFAALMIPAVLAVLTAAWAWTLPEKKGVILSAAENMYGD